MVKPNAPTDGGTGKWAWHTWLHDHVVVPLPDGAEVASKDYVDNSANFAVIIRGTLASTADLPNNAETGDGWVVDGVLWVWNGTEWLDLGTFQGETGPVGMVWRGPWDATVAYAADDAVSHGGQSWIATAATVAGDEPGVAAAWDVLAAQGATGSQGDTGLQGPQGDPGVVWRGDWVSTTAYVVDDAVQHDGSAWVAVADSTGVTPSDAAVEWDLFAAGGQDGTGVPATVLSPTVTAPSQAGVVGASTDFARQDHEHPSDEFLTPAAGNAAYSTDSGATSLTADTVSALGAWEQWGTETVNLGNPGQAVTVLAWASGYASDTTASAIAKVQVQVSLDGGSTWTSGNGQFADLNGTDITRVGQSSQARASGTPTGDVVVRAQIQQSGGTAGDATWFGGRLMAVMHR